jgi:hypothetical protein
MLADKKNGVLSIIPAWKHLWEKVRLSFGVNKQSEISYAILDELTGKPNYQVNDGFLRHNTKAIEQRMLIEKTSFIQAYNATMKDDEKLTNVGRFSSIPLKKMNTAALLELSKYINADISLADIQAGKLDKIRAITGESAEVGKFIRNYSLHNVVQSQSFNLAKIGKYFSNMTMAYAARQEALPLLEIVKQHYQSILKPKENNTSQNIFNKRSNKNQMDGTRTGANQQMDDWFERVVLDNYGLPHTGVHGAETKDVTEDGEVSTKIPWYGRRIFSNEEKSKIKEVNRLLSKETNEATIKKLQELKQGFGKDRTATAFFDNILSWVRTLRLGYNLSSATTNFLEGVTSNMIISAQGQYFNPEEIFYGYGVVKHSFLKNATFGYIESGAAKKNRRLMDKFNIIMDSKNELQKSSHKTFAAKLAWMNPHALNQRVEYINQSPIMIAVLRTRKINDKDGTESSIWDALDNSGHLKDEFKTEDNINNWENLSGKEYLDFKQAVHKAIVLGHGNYDELRGMMIKSKTAGKALAMFKTWLPMQLYWRFALEQDDIQTGVTGFKGRYLSYGAGTGLVHGAAVAGLALGPIGAIAGAGLGAIIGGAFGTKSDISMLQQSIEASKQLVKKLIGMPVNLITGITVGKRVINDGDKAFNNWVGKGNFTQQDAKNLRGNMADITLQLIWLASILMVKSLLWDDDKDKIVEGETPEEKKLRDAKFAQKRAAHNILVNRFMNLSNQAAMYSGDVTSLWKSTFGSVAIVQYMTELSKEVAAANDYLNGEDIIQSGVNKGKSKLGVQTGKILMPGLFKDNIFGFESQAQRVFDESPYHTYFKSASTKDRENNKRQREKRRLELEDIYDKNDDEQNKEINRLLNEELPTPARLKKYNMTRKEYENWLDQQPQ